MTTETKKTESKKAPAKKAASKKSTVQYASVTENLVVILEPEDKVTDGFGKTIQHRPGNQIEFSGGSFVTDDKDQIEALEEHEAFGRDFVKAGEDVVLSPTEGDQYASIAGLAGQLNVEGLKQLISDEEESHNRKEIIKVAESALEGIAANAVVPEAGSAEAESGVRTSTSKP